uniref:Uncharacterized protein n=1 Tax=Polytomella parva TaxID=51329 RepID=A0A7S0UU08_9CHLO|mmetsp:Transcript_17949/g.32775  ORF Transcript_17949/g.32775 Transcript_17949/m.32775 type:complete len:181 (+) Transcript_17949:47-589(+)
MHQALLKTGTQINATLKKRVWSSPCKVSLQSISTNASLHQKVLNYQHKLSVVTNAQGKSSKSKKKLGGPPNLPPSNDRGGGGGGGNNGGDSDGGGDGDGGSNIWPNLLLLAFLVFAEQQVHFAEKVGDFVEQFKKRLAESRASRNRPDAKATRGSKSKSITSYQKRSDRKSSTEKVASIS